MATGVILDEITTKGTQNQSWLCRGTVGSIHREFHWLKDKQGIGEHGELLAEPFPSVLRKDVCYSATVL